MTTTSLKESGTRLCITVTEQDVSVYGNKQAFTSLSKLMSSIAEANEDDHFECHVVMSLEDDRSKFESKEPRNVGCSVTRKSPTRLQSVVKIVQVLN